MNSRPCLLLLLIALLAACASWPEDGGQRSNSSGNGGGWLNWPGPVVDSRDVSRSGSLSWPEGPEDAGLPERNSAALSSSVLQAAIAVKGRPYRLGATGPNAFDCSGLVYYAHRQAGIDIPRTTSRQYRAARHVDRRNMSEGDVIFFAVDGISISHVGLYAGNGRFIHSPSPGSRVSWASLDNSYWASRFAGAGRFQ